MLHGLGGCRKAIARERSLEVRLSRPRRQQKLGERLANQCAHKKINSE